MLTHIPEIRKRENRMSVCCHFSCVQLFVTLWTVARQAPLFMGFSRQEYWSGLPSSSKGSSQPRDQTRVSYVFCISRWVLYHWHYLGSPNRGDYRGWSSWGFSMCFKAMWVLFDCLWSCLQLLRKLSPHPTQVRKLLQEKNCSGHRICFFQNGCGVPTGVLEDCITWMDYLSPVFVDCH